MLFKEAPLDALVWIATFLKVRDCFTLVTILRRPDVPLWEGLEWNVDGTRNVDRRSPLHHTLVTNYRDHLKCASTFKNRPPFRFGAAELMDGSWGFASANQQPQVVLTGSTGLQVLVDELFDQSDYDLFVTYQSAERVRSSLLKHTNLVCVDFESKSSRYATMGTRFHHVENYALEPSGYRICSNPECAHLDACPSRYNLACAAGRKHRFLLRLGGTMLRSGQPNCCSEDAFPMDQAVRGGYVQLIVGQPKYTSVLQLTSGFDILQCRISYDGEKFRLVSPYVSATQNMLFDKWLSLPSSVFGNLANMFAHHYPGRISTSGPHSPFQFRAACATMYRLHKYRQRGFHLGKAPRFYNHISWPDVDQHGHTECVVLRGAWSKTEYHEEGPTVIKGPVEPYPPLAKPVHHKKWIKGRRTVGTQTSIVKHGV